LLVAWRGLGYYRRARLLQQGARAVVERHGGSVPNEVEALAELPGIGTYTCGAVASIAFGRPVVAIDGNVLRVTARHRGIRLGIDTAAGQRAVAMAVDGWLERARPGDFNQAMMELGAVLCTKASPRCDDCPVGADCVARATGTVADLPVKKAPRAAVEVTARTVVVVDGGRVLGHRLPAGEPNAGQVDLPGAGILVSVDIDDMAAALDRRFGAKMQVGAELVRVRHAITHHRIELHAHAATLRQRGRLQWFPLAATTPWTTPARKVFAAAGLVLPEQSA
jgi:A/G-specific adenine glycosylase